MKFLAMMLLGCLLLWSGAAAGQVVSIHGKVVDRSGAVVEHATVTLRFASHELSVVSESNGEFSADVTSNSSPIEIIAAWGKMVSAAMRVPVADLSQPLVLTVAPVSVNQQVNVTATRSGVEMGPSARTIESISSSELEQYPALTFDERLRQHAGFELFRRSSGWVQNPTSQGISLRGLGSTAASRTLVLADGAPLNDPFGGWIHWNEIPPEAIDSVTIASGGGSDLYGSSALGGVIDVIPDTPTDSRGEISVSGAGEDTATASGRGDLKQDRWGELAAGQYFRTDGYTLIAPALRGPVDIPANVHFESGRTEIDRAIAGNGRAFLLGNVLNEARSNGTPDTTNATRLWRYLGGDDWSHGSRLTGRARVFGSDEAYRQSFSAVIGAARATEMLTRLQHVETQEIGASTDASFQFSHAVFVAGADIRDLRATDFETPISAGNPAGLQDTTARQRFFGGFGEALGEYKGWSGTASLRVDRAQNLATSTLLQTAGVTTETEIPNRSEVVLSPRIGLVRKLGPNAELHATAFRAFRSPTMNELYRTGQVGQETTVANASLVSERATGAEGGIGWRPRRLALNATYFWTEINRPVSAVVLSSTATSITEMRENLGQIQSQGVELNARVDASHGLSANFGYEYAHAIVTQFSAQPQLVGNWIPEVPRQSAAAQLRAENRRFGSATLALREGGRAYDDSANTYLLHSFFTVDMSAERSLSRGWMLFLTGQNLLDRKVEVARTPILTLGAPRTIQGGVRFRWGAAK